MSIKEALNLQQLPKHIAIILDGNGRWAKNRGLPRVMGHRAGMNRVIDMVETCVDLGIGHLTLYAFSTENWKRPEAEVNALMGILIEYVANQLDRLIQHNVKLVMLGDLGPIPDRARQAVIQALEKTAHNTGMILNIALNYGGRDELLRAVKQLVVDCQEGRDPLALTEADIAQVLYTSGQPDPDLLIRPGGEKRISNFLIYQTAYSEFYFSDTLWPDFDANALYQAILDFQGRQRRYGGLK